MNRSDAHAGSEPLPPNDPAGALALIICARLRRHGHLSNLFTHISNGRWDKVQGAFEFLFSDSFPKGKYDALTANILDLACRFDGPSAKVFRAWLVEQLENGLPSGAGDIVARWGRASRSGDDISALASPARDSSGVPRDSQAGGSGRDNMKTATRSRAEL